MIQSNEFLNLQKPKTSKIFGVIKSGANNGDINAIKILQKQGFNEHEIQVETGVNFMTIRSFMALEDPDFKPTDVPRTPENKPLYDRIELLEKQIAESKAAERTEPAQRAEPAQRVAPSPARSRGRPAKVPA